MKNRKHYIVVENPNPSWVGYDKFLVVPENDLNKQFPMHYKTKEEAEECAKRYNTTYYISDYSEDEIDEFFNSVDFKPLEDALNNKLGTQLTFTHSYSLVRGDYRIKFCSNEDLCKVSQAGLIAKMLKECFLEQFSNGIHVNKETGELYIWLTVNFSYHHFDMGSNGCNLCGAVYKNGKWEITFEEDRMR